MTKSHLLIYVVTIFCITIAAYLYTSVAEAPHNLTLDDAKNSITEHNEEPKAPSVITPSVSSIELLEKSNWIWLQTVDKDSTVYKPKNSEAFILTLANGHMSSKTDCNTIGGDYSLSDEALTFSGLVSTLMFCEGSDESVYSAMLVQITGFTVSDQELKLSTRDGSVMLFKAQPK